MAEIEVHIRTIPGRLMWLADHLETEGHNKGVRLGVAAGLRLIAEEMTAHNDGSLRQEERLRQGHEPPAAGHIGDD